MVADDRSVIVSMGEGSALVDQIRAVHKLRMRQVYGGIQASELAAIDRGLYLFLGLESPEYKLT